MSTNITGIEGAFIDLLEFENACKRTLSNDQPGLPDFTTLTLALKLIKEEYHELQHAVETQNIPEVADAITDLIYVLIQMSVRFGIDLPPVWQAVQNANMAKFGSGSWLREDGKVMKPPDWKKPDIESIVKNQKPLSLKYGS